jgi:hypothetical protein
MDNQVDQVDRVILVTTVMEETLGLMEVKEHPEILELEQIQVQLVLLPLLVGQDKMG